MDLFAVKIMTSLERQIGWVPHTHSFRIGFHIDDDGQADRVVGTLLHGENSGVLVLVPLKDKDETDAGSEQEAIADYH